MRKDIPLMKHTLDKSCESCNHSEVCMYKEDFQKAYKEIHNIGERDGVFIQVIVNCKHWIAGIQNVR